MPRGMGSVKTRFSAPMIGRSVVLLFFALGLLAGPASAECSSCCPSPAERTVEIGSLGCCGGPCGVTLERPDSDRAATSVQKNSVDISTTSVVELPLSDALRAGDLTLSAFDLPPPSSYSTPSPLRL